MLQEYGLDYDWINDNDLIARLLANGVDVTSYDDLYDWCEGTLQMPWVADEYFFGDEVTNVGTSWDILEEPMAPAFVEFIAEFKNAQGDEWWTVPSEEWVARDERFAETFKEYWTDSLPWITYIRPHITTILVAGEHKGMWTAGEVSSFYTNGPDFEWWSHPTVLAELMVLAIDDNFVENAAYLLNYEQCYAIFDYIGYPWILDTKFDDPFHIHENGAGINAIEGFMNAWMFDSDGWEESPPEGWMPFDDRIVPYYPYEPTEEILRLYLRDEIADAIEKLEELDGQIEAHPLEDLDWDHADDEDFDDLSDLLFEVQDYAEGTYLVM